MSNSQLETAIESAWDARDQITPETIGEQRDAIEDTLNALDSGRLRVAERRAVEVRRGARDFHGVVKQAPFHVAFGSHLVVSGNKN